MDKVLFLGDAIRRDRNKKGISQANMNYRLEAYMEKQFKKLNKKQFLKKFPDIPPYHYYHKRGAPHPRRNLVAQLERGVYRTVRDYELVAIADVLEGDFDEYKKLEPSLLEVVKNQDHQTEEASITHSLERSIEFDPEYRASGISILSFFSEIVESEFSAEDVKVGILQSGNTVTLRIETPEGALLKEVEETLNQYGLVVLGEKPVESLSKNQALINDLKTRLALTETEIRLKNEFALANTKQYENRISSLECQLASLQNMVGQGLLQNNSLIEVIKFLSPDTQSSDLLKEALATIAKLSNSSGTEAEISEVNKTLSILEKESPGILSKIAKHFETIPATVCANITSPWIQQLIQSFPR